MHDVEDKLEDKMHEKKPKDKEAAEQEKDKS